MSKSVTKLASIALFGGLIGRGLRYALNIIISRGLGPDALGLFAFGMVVMKATGLFARAGLDNAAQKFIPKYRQNDDAAQVSGIVLLCLGTPLLIGSVLAVVVSLNPDFFTRFTGQAFGSVAQDFALGIPLFAAMMVGISATKGLKETKYSVYIRDFGQSIVAIVLVGAGVYIVGDIHAAILGYVGSFFVGVVLAVLFLFREGAIRLDIRPIFESQMVFAYSLPLVITAVTQYVIRWTDIFVLSALTEPQVVGWYQAAYQTSVLLVVVLQSASAIFPALAADLYHDEQYERLDQIYTAVTKWIAYLTLLGYLFIAIHAKTVLAVFDISARPAQIALIVVGLGQMIVAAVGPVGYLLTMTEHERLYVVNTAAAAALNVVLNLVLINEFGVVGAAAATAVSFTILNVLTLFEVWYLLDVQPYSRSYWKGLVAVAGAFVVMILGQQLPVYGIWRMLLVGICSFCVFAGIIWVIGIDETDKTLVESIDR